MNSDERTFLVKTASGNSQTLKQGASISIGRDGDNDLVLGEESVGEHHTKLTWPAGKPPRVEDLGSRCGTFLNGIRLFRDTQLPLASGTIHVGGVELQLLFANREALLTGISDRVSLFSDSGPDLKGRLTDQDSLKDVMRQLENGKRTGTLIVTSADGESSELTFYMGKVMGADRRGVEGLEALKAIMASCAGAGFAFAKEFEPKDQQLGHWPSDLFRAKA